MEVELKMESDIVDGIPIGRISLSVRHRENDGKDIEVTVESPDGTYRTIRGRLIPELMRQEGMSPLAAVRLVNIGLVKHRMTPVRMARQR